MEIYIKPVKKISIFQETNVYLKDISEVYAPDNIIKKIKDIKILKIKDNTEKNYLISVIDIINAIDKVVTGHTINNVGEMDTIVEFSPKKPKENKFVLNLKIFAVTLILLAGSSTAIMSFHSDAQLGKVFENYYYIFFNEKIQNPLLLDLPYSIGLALGIIIFFNHFSGKKITNDPTPIEVEMSLYETNVTDNIIDTLNNEKNAKGKESWKWFF